MRRLLCPSTLTAVGLRWASSTEEGQHSPPRNKFSSHPRVVPLTTAEIRAVPRINQRWLGVINDRAFIDRSGIKEDVSISEDNEGKVLGAMSAALSRLCPAISSFVYELGIPLAIEQVAELFVPMLVFAEDALLGKESCDSVLVLDDIDSATAEDPGYLYHQRRLTPDRVRSNTELVKSWYASENLHEIPPLMASRIHIVDNYAFDRYFDLVIKCLADHGKSQGLYVAVDDDGRAYVMPGSIEFFLRRIYPCIRKDAPKSLFRVFLSAGWTGFGRSRLADDVVLLSYFDYITAIDDSLVQCDRPFQNATSENIFVVRKQSDFILESVNELTRILSERPPPSVTPAPAPLPSRTPAVGEMENQFAHFNVEESSPLFKLYTNIVKPNALRIQSRGLSTLVAYLQSERALISGVDELNAFQQIALATRLATPSFVLEVLAKCPAKRAKDANVAPLPSWCLPMFAGYLVAGDDLKGIEEMHVREAVKTVLNFDKSDCDDDSLRNACIELKQKLFQHYDFLPSLHAQVLLCTFRFMQKHEQLHRALKKSIVAENDVLVKSSRIKEIIGNVNNSLTELEYCIDANLMRIPTMPLAKGRVRPTEDPEAIKMAKANALYQYWYVDWLASKC